ncbi:TetR/AcrR family transcriptional regulator [Pseudomonas sp. ICMP 561]|uniref:TetR/AcrR family transcriptional regulator n=1 Tax=Pseudomonas sp. ICMP 561 TaxID=1718918 RepID=UPI000C07E0D8|nr:TetR/AcrR family transcriptional regulator [Pseudomonas sp. ICMP 561]PHN17197.1 hypothetical protein AO242_21110 [Pseudomonas sp. ICMP 561]
MTDASQNDRLANDKPPSKARRAVKGPLRREAILNAALEVFSRDGYSAASVNTIAEIAEITTAGLLHHFPNKVALLTGVLERRDEESRKLTGAMLNSRHLYQLFNNLRTVNRANVNMAGVVRVFTVLNAESLTDTHPAWEWYQSRYQGLYKRLLTEFEALRSYGEVREDVDLLGVVQEIIAMMDGLQIQWLRFPDQLWLVERFDVYLKRLEEDLRPKKRGLNHEPPNRQLSE